ncbi:hypothetical protein G6O67_003502 [Ophiocordyceps sinensis]|uniref:Alpha-1,2-mannosyltransferase (Mnn2) n=1 Tax=Ophiocordyceps sinensis TaxID=72228 RepID=A0A8H4V8P7_9HYPO|nr:hypothetical protein G6O67_003502 [Ophiocordyceps sinensis]
MRVSGVTRQRRILPPLILACVLVWYLTTWKGVPFNRPVDPHDASGQDANHDGFIKFWSQLQPLLMAHEPRCEPPRRLGDAPASGFEASGPAPRPDLLEMSARDLLKMETAHSDFVRAIIAHPPDMPYVPRSRGLVTTAGGFYLPVLVISLRMLRRTGSKLPVEVFLATRDEFEDDICGRVLPELNARCVVLSDVLDSVPGTVKMEKYQLKPCAIIFSSFEEMLFLDADAFPVARPETLFEEEPFKGGRMVTWPDFWASSASPLYYTIASQQVTPMDSRQSTESGQILVSKKTHLRTLLLCTYYNFWGPTHYYRLLSQGGPGEGDKETLVAAAAAVGEPFYQVSERVRAVGHPTRDGFAGSAMVQFHPVDDFKLTQRGEWRVNKSTAPAPRPFFIHANYPKFNPATLFAKGHVNPTLNDDGTYTRAWTNPQDTMEAFGSDVEKGFWTEILWTACELETSFESWRGQTGICDGVKSYWRAVFGAESPDVANRKDVVVLPSWSAAIPSCMLNSCPLPETWRGVQSSRPAMAALLHLM